MLSHHVSVKTTIRPLLFPWKTSSQKQEDNTFADADADEEMETEDMTESSDRFDDNETREGFGRPLSAAASDRFVGVRLPRPSLTEGHGRPMSAAASDKVHGARLRRPDCVEGHGRPMSAVASDRVHGARLRRPDCVEGHGRPMSAAASDHRNLLVEGKGLLLRPEKHEGGRPRTAPSSDTEQDQDMFLEKDEVVRWVPSVDDDDDDDDGAPSLPAPVVVTANRQIVAVEQVKGIDGYFKQSPEMYNIQLKRFLEEESNDEKEDEDYDDDDAPSLPAPVIVTANRQVVAVKQVRSIGGYFKQSPENVRKFERNRDNFQLKRFQEEEGDDEEEGEMQYG